MKVRNKDAPGPGVEEFPFTQVEEQPAVDEEPRMPGVPGRRFLDFPARPENSDFHPTILMPHRAAPRKEPEYPAF